jgi:hypothetical protein
VYRDFKPFQEHGIAHLWVHFWIDTLFPNNQRADSSEIRKIFLILLLDETVLLLTQDLAAAREFVRKNILD